MKWIVGIDLRHRSDGAIKFAHWLRRTSAEVEACGLVGVHVVESGSLTALTQAEPRPLVLQRLADESRLVIENAGATEDFLKIDAIEGRAAAHSLEAACVYHHADGLVVGRKAATDERALIRLGSVARQLLRSLSAPVFVVAPDLDAATIGAGPIVVAVTPNDASKSAVGLARALGRRLGRDVLFVRVVTVPEDYAHIYWSGAALAAFREQFLDRAGARLREWLGELGLAEARHEVRYGPEVSEILAVAHRSDAPFVVCGSRLLGPLERMLTPSTSSELAAHAPGAVLVVPPDHGGRFVDGDDEA
ncbi:MAG: universal stress protein [Nannocystaceae bacterium]